MAKNYLDFYMSKDTHRISYSKDISLTQYSTAYTVRLFTNTVYPVINMNITTGNGIHTYKKNLVLSSTKSEDGYYVYSKTLGLDITGYEFQDEKSIIRLAFYIYPEESNNSIVYTTNICYLPLLKSTEGMPSDGSITDSELNNIQGAINDINEKLVNLNVGVIDTAKNYNTKEGNILDKFNELTSKINKNTENISNISTPEVDKLKSDVSKNTNDIATLKDNTFKNTSDITSINTKLETLQAGVKYTIAESLPVNGDAGTIYLVLTDKPSDENTYTEYMWINNAWEIIGSTATTGDINLSNYYTKKESDDKYALKTNIPTKVSELTNDSGYLTKHQDISNLATKEEVDNVSSSIPNKVSQLENDSKYVNDATLANTKNTLQNQLDTQDSTLSSLATGVSESNRLANEALALAKNVSSLVYNTFDDMINSLKESITGAIVGTNIFIKDMNIPDYWITSVLVSDSGSYTAPDGTKYTGLYYTISPIESKIDLSDYYSVSESDNKFATKTELNSGLSNKENSSNKATTIDSNSNNTTYPSTAAVKNYIKNTVDDINTSVDSTYATKESLTSNISTLTTKIEKVENDYKASDTAIQENIENLNTALGEEIVNAKSYTDSKVSRDNLVSVIKEATTTLNGLLSSEDKRRLNAMYAVFGNNPDENTFVDTVNEVLNIFNQYPEGTNIVEYLNTKVNISDIVDNLTSEETTKPLSAKQGKVLKDGIISGDIPSGAASSIIDRLDNKKVKLAFTGSETDYTVNDTDISSITTLLSIFSPNEYN